MIINEILIHNFFLCALSITSFTLLIKKPIRTIVNTDMPRRDAPYLRKKQQKVRVFKQSFGVS